MRKGSLHADTGSLVSYAFRLTTYVVPINYYYVQRKFKSFSTNLNRLFHTIYNHHHFSLSDCNS